MQFCKPIRQPFILTGLHRTRWEAARLGSARRVALRVRRLLQPPTTPTRLAKATESWSSSSTCAGAPPERAPVAPKRLDTARRLPPLISISALLERPSRSGLVSQLGGELPFLRPPAAPLPSCAAGCAIESSWKPQGDGRANWITKRDKQFKRRQSERGPFARGGH